MRTRTPGTLPAALLALLVVLSSCAPPSAPDPAAQPVAIGRVAPDFVHGTDRSSIDQLAATVVTDVQKYWRGTFPTVLHGRWRDLDGGFFSVNTARSAEQPPPCTSDAREVEGNAYYCPGVDAVAWDRVALLPVLREHYGDMSVAVVLAHEIGHAVQQRNSSDPRTIREPARMEAVADCYAGAYSRWVSDGESPHLRVTDAQLDRALRALIVFRDPIGTASSASDAHGTAFDRVAAFQEGFGSGPDACSTIPADQVPTSAAREQHRQLDDVVRDPGYARFFAGLSPDRHWKPPELSWQRDRARRSPCAGEAVAYCTDPPAIIADRSALAGPHHDIGDQATATLLASRYALAALRANGDPAVGSGASERATCLTGAYTATGSHDRLTPGDLDAAVEVVLTNDTIGADATGANPLTGLERFAAFRSGAVGGADACGAAG